MELTGRREQILSSIVEFYIASGEPVGSKLLAEILPFQVSSATIRHEMASLSEMGYLEQPHTSAGRIPSDKGLRYYVDRLLKGFSPSQSEMFRIGSGIDRFEGDTKRLLTQSCEILSELTGTAALATTPYFANALIRSVQLVPVEKRSVLVVLTTSAGVLQSRIAQLDSEPDYELLELFYRVAAANFTGSVCAELTTPRMQTIAASLGERSLDILPLLVSLGKAVEDSANADVIVTGRARLLSQGLRAHAAEMIDLFEQPDAMLTLLKKPSSESEVRLTIGRENGYRFLDDASLITCPYRAGDTEAGVIGVLAPIKTDYAHVIPLVKYLAGTVSELITTHITQNE